MLRCDNFSKIRIRKNQVRLLGDSLKKIFEGSSKKFVTCHKDLFQERYLNYVKVVINL